MPKHAAVTDAVSVAAYSGSSALSPRLCLRLLRLTLAQVCGFAYACVPASHTHGAGRGTKGREGGREREGSALLKSQRDATLVRIVTSNNSGRLCFSSSMVTAQRSLDGSKMPKNTCFQQPDVIFSSASFTLNMNQVCSWNLCSPKCAFVLVLRAADTRES